MRQDLVRCSASQDKAALSRFVDVAVTLSQVWEVDVHAGLLNMIDREDQGMISLDKVPQSRISIGAVRPSDQTRTSSKKWHPLTYAIHYENIDLVQHLIKRTKSHLKKLLRVPELSK